jgi:membrane associated rhomboid family serine protease
MASRFRFQSKKSTGNQATLGLIIALAIGFVLSWLPQPGEFLQNNLALWFDHPQIWQFITYPLISGGGGFGLIFFLFELMWLYQYGGQIESRYGPKTLLGNFLLSSVAFGVVGLLGSKLFGGAVPLLSDSWLPIAYIIVLACATQPNADFCFWGISVKYKWLALLMGLFAIFGYGTGAPLFGVVIALPLLFAWFYGQNKVPGVILGKNIFVAKQEKKRVNREFDEFKSKVRDKEKDRLEKERLRKLFEGSLDDQDPPQAER